MEKPLENLANVRNCSTSTAIRKGVERFVFSFTPALTNAKKIGTVQIYFRMPRKQKRTPEQSEALPGVQSKPVAPIAPDLASGLSTSQSTKRTWHFHWGRIAAGAGIAVALMIMAIGWKMVSTGTRIFHGNDNSSTLQQLGRLIVPGDRELKADDQGRTNILLVGHGGDGHEGPWLADTIIVASLQQKTGEVATLSIPRDFIANLPDYGYRKINNALAFGRTKANPNGGDALISSVVSEVIGQPIHYFARVDFTGFKKAVDDVGGVTITVDTPFVDSSYPTYNYGYQTIQFEAGEQKMAGEKALQFARSRKGSNGEGSDFARSLRQQKLLFAFREKALSLGTLTNPGRISDLLSTLGNHVGSSMELWEVMRMASILKNLNASAVATRVLDATEADSLVKSSSGTDGAYIIQPRLGIGNYQEIHELFTNIFTYNAIAKENVPVQLQNGTGQTGIAEIAGRSLRSYSFDVESVANPKDLRYEQSVIVDLSNGRASQTVAMLKEKFGASVTTTLPGDLTLQTGTLLNRNTATQRPAEVLVVLGQSAITIVNNTLSPAARTLPRASAT